MTKQRWAAVGGLCVYACVLITAEAVRPRIEQPARRRPVQAWQSDFVLRDNPSQRLFKQVQLELTDVVTAHMGIGFGVAEGRDLFLHKWSLNDPRAAEGDGLGPVCNANSCATCHFKGGVGGAGDIPEVMAELGVNTPALFGVGLIDRIPDDAIHGGERGMVNSVRNGVGKFGWGAEFATLREFVATAAAVELGLTNGLRRQDMPGRALPDRFAALDLNSEQLDALVTYCRSLPRPRQIMPSDHAAAKRVVNGERIFRLVGCADCHSPNLGTVTGLYSDLRLHEIGTAVPKDGNWGNGWNGYSSGWKTPPLWGVADSAPYLHDGSAPTLREAILAHKGSARRVTKRFQETTPEWQEDLILFLGSLRAPVAAEPCPESLRGNVHIAPGGIMCY